MSAVRDRASAALDALLAKGLVGAGLVGRDGLPLLFRFTRPVPQETFAAMTAALVGAAEAALQEIGQSGGGAVTAEAGSLRMAAAGVDDQHILVLVAPTAVPADTLGQSLAMGRKSIQGVLRG